MYKHEIRLIRLQHRKFRKGQITLQEWWDFLEPIKHKHGAFYLKKVLEENVFQPESAARKRLTAYKDSPLYRFRIRKCCNRHDWSDIEPYEVVRVISPRKVEIRQMRSILVQSPEYTIGGFLAHTQNETQVWECVPDIEMFTEIITLTKKGWSGGKFRMSDSPRKFYDYNF